MRNPWEWDEDDLLKLVRAGTQESIELDFKESASLQKTERKKEDISKDVSAFANSAGGILVYGVTEERYTHIATGIDTGCDPIEVPKEWLEQVINSTIHQRIDGVRVRQVPLIKSRPGKVAYIVYVPFSTRTPHQAVNKKFYKRFNFESVPMEEYEIRDLYMRGEVPDLRINFDLPETELVYQQKADSSNPFPLYALILNDALEPANYAVIKVFIDKRLKIHTTALTIKDGFGIRVGNGVLQVYMLTMNWGIPGKLPIFNEPFALSDEPIKLSIPLAISYGENQFCLIGYEIKSPRMSMKNRFALLRWGMHSIELFEQNISAEELVSNPKYNRLLDLK